MGVSCCYGSVCKTAGGRWSGLCCHRRGLLCVLLHSLQFTAA